MARTLDWVAVSFSRGSSWSQNQTPGLLHCRQILYRLSYEGSLSTNCTYSVLIFVLTSNTLAPITLHCSFPTSSLVFISLSPRQEKPMNNSKHLPGTVHEDSVTQSSPEAMTPQRLLSGSVIRHQDSVETHSRWEKSEWDRRWFISQQSERNYVSPQKDCKREEWADLVGNITARKALTNVSKAFV